MSTLSGLQLFIVTGHSRGLGAAMTGALLSQGHHVVGLSRGRLPGWDEANESGLVHAWASAPGGLTQWRVDLSEPQAVATRLADALAGQVQRPWQQVTLVNNAALMNRLGPVEAESPAALSRALRAGLEAPMLLSAAWLAGTREWGMPRRILNISSGLGRRAMAGSAPYCAIKAGMDHLSRAMALDEAHKASQGLPAATVVSLAPGVIDTDMQVQIRGSQGDGFPDRQRFLDLQAQQQLASAEATAERVLRFLAHPGFGQDVIADIRDFQD